MVLKFKKSEYQDRHESVSWELKVGAQSFTEGWSHTYRPSPLVGKSCPWDVESSVSGSARAQLSEQEVWTFPKVSKELWWFF